MAYKQKGWSPYTKRSPLPRTKLHKGGMSAAERREYNNETGGNVQGRN